MNQVQVPSFQPSPRREGSGYRFTGSVRHYMTSPVRRIPMDASLDEVTALLESSRISALAVVDRAGMLRGVISRADLIAGIPQEAHCVADLMSTPALTISVDEPLSAAARGMVDGEVHRMFVTEGRARELVGVIATPDLMRAIRDQRITRPVGEIVSGEVETVSSDTSIESAIERLQRSKAHGIVAMDAGWPIGVFDQAVALRARALPSAGSVESVLNWAVLVVDEKLALWHVAAQALATATHRIVVLRGREVLGVVNGFDFARSIA